jgi:hypothetical protein
MTSELQVAIERLYGAFAHRPMPSHVEGCPHCLDDSDHELLKARPLRQLTAQHLKKYTFRAMTTWGDANDFAHFLPRLLELLASESGGLFDPELLLGKLELARWRTWSADEVSAVERYLFAAWRAILTDYPGPLAAADFLTGLSRLFDDLAPFLDIWSADHSLAALRHLTALILDNRNALWSKGALNRAGWRSAQLAQVVAWLRSSAVVERLERGFFAHSNAPFASELSQAHECLAAAAK